jgi:hypothetical protein
MKLFVFLICALMLACSGKTTRPSAVPSKIEIQLAGLNADKRFNNISKDIFLYPLGSGSEVKILKYEFKNQTELQSYLLNRRMLLHRDFQNNIAPYVGMLETDKSCIEKVDSKGEIQEKNSTTSFLTMRFPVTSSYVISDCLKNDVWGILVYHFYNCKKANQLFEIKYRHSVSQPEAEFSISCE